MTRRVEQPDPPRWRRHLALPAVFVAAVAAGFTANLAMGTFSWYGTQLPVSLAVQVLAMAHAERWCRPAGERVLELERRPRR